MTHVVCVLTAVHPTTNPSARQMAQHTTMCACLSKKCVSFDLTSPYSILEVVKVRSSKKVANEQNKKVANEQNKNI